MQQKHSYINQYKLIKTLWKGFQAKVKLAEAPNKQLVAIKIYKKENYREFKYQASTLSKLKHENIVSLVQVGDNSVYKKYNGISYQCSAIILEYTSEGSLFQFIQLGKLTPNISRTYFNQLINALRYMHQTGIAHRNLQPENILLCDNLTLKITDFGFSAPLQGKNKSEIFQAKLGKKAYLAPEILQNKSIGTQADIFSAGVILFAMYTGHPPFNNIKDNLYQLIKRKQYASYWSLISRNKPIGFFTQQFKNLINGMLCSNSQQRYNIQQIMNHSWTKGSCAEFADIRSEFQHRKQQIKTVKEKKLSNLVRKGI